MKEPQEKELGKQGYIIRVIKANLKEKEKKNQQPKRISLKDNNIFLEKKNKGIP